MKLYYCTGISMDIDYFEHIVANSEEEARETFEAICNDMDIEHGGIYVKEVTVSSDYELIIRDKRNYPNGSNYFN
ncbi:hypothetical protein CHH83_02260 [Bacillus sp. 7586-K]|nr:hypothetical protein CHH83_02260 [Bacillus sp. 7586-K]